MYISTSELCLERGQECDRLKGWILLPLWPVVLAFPVNSCFLCYEDRNWGGGVKEN